jgi:hypothetical protein
MMTGLTSLAKYEALVYSLADRYPTILRATLVVIPRARGVADVSGDIDFVRGIRLGVREYLRFDLRPARLLQYSYEVWRGGEKLYWYDSQPHPDDPVLATTHPHHKHVPPNIKHNRLPAPNLSFTEPNLPQLIEEIERELL